LGDLWYKCTTIGYMRSIWLKIAAGATLVVTMGYFIDSSLPLAIKSDQGGLNGAYPAAYP